MEYRPVVRNEEIDQLFESILRLETLEDCYRFFEDLCTIKEVGSMAQRLQVAKLLKRGATYHEVVEKTGASTATIGRINRCLLYGADGYHRALARLEKEEEE